MADPYGGTRAGTGAADDRVNRWMNPLETIELTDQEALHNFTETGRQVCRYMAVITSMGGTELEEGIREMVRGTGNKALFGLDVRRKIKRVVRHFTGASDALEAAAGQLVAIWAALDKEFADEMAAMGHAPTKKGFSIS